MFSHKQIKPNLNNINTNNKLIEDLFDSVENKNENKVIEYINNPDYKVWQMKDDINNTILHKSCFFDFTQLSITIIQEIKKRLGSSSLLSNFINEKNDEGLTALHYAAYKGNIELSKILVQNGALVNSLTNRGKNIIHLSAEGNHPSAMIYFIYKEKFDIYTGDENGSSPLHWACYSGAEESVNFLIGLNADIDAQDKEKLTPLHLATLNNREKIVIKLLQNGADKNLKNSRGELAIDIARKKNFHSLVFILEDKEYNPLCTLESPMEYINPSNIYKKFIVIMIVLPEIFIFFLVLPYLEKVINIILNNSLFLIVFLLFIILFFKDPGYKKDNSINDDIFNINNDYPLLKLVEKNIDIKHYCPKCYIPESNKIKHCIICDKCVEGFSHHCFWLNLCIGKKNKIFYFLFIFFSLIFSYHSLFICLYSLFDFSNKPFEKLIFFCIFQNGKDRELRVFFCGLIAIFSLIISFPLTFLIFIEIFKFFKIKLGNNSKSLNFNIKDEMIKLESKKNVKNNNNALENDENNNYEENCDLLGLNRDTNLIHNNNEKEIVLSLNSNVPIPQTPFSVDKKDLADFPEE